MKSGEYQKHIHENLGDDYIKGLLEGGESKIIKTRRFIAEEGRGKKILDVGCADGSVTEVFVPENKVYGIEITEEFSRRARQKGLIIKEADVESGFPFETGKFDIVVCGEIIEHVIHTDLFLSECNRVLKPGGKLIISLPNINTLLSPLLMLLFDYPPAFSACYRSIHVRDFTISTVKIALEGNKFSVEKIVGAELFIPFVRKFRGVRSFLANIFPRCAGIMIVKAKKVGSVKYNHQKTIKEIREDSTFLLKRYPVFKWFLK